uniref:Uncharacterized protein n=1 Tax=Panagrolaimus superbus TaxID=310955 RepID=A0A914ZBL2_9BILA
MSIIHSFTLCVLQYFRLYALDTILSSKLDEDVSPKCRWGNKSKKQCNDQLSACSDVSTYISEEGRSTPQYNEVKLSSASSTSTTTTAATTTKEEEFKQYDNLECQIADEESPISSLPTTCHKKQKSAHSHDSGASNETKSTVAEISSMEFDVISGKSIEGELQRQRKDSIGSVDPKEFEETNSPAFSCRNFTLPLSH